jgi:hypothetical protein
VVTIKVAGKNGEQLASRLFWLAYHAAKPASGMGALQARPKATEAQVWANVRTAGDYPTNHHPEHKPYADYVFGKMLKVGCTIEGDSITISDWAADPEYHDWAAKYPTTQHLCDAVVASFGPPEAHGAGVG